MDHKIAVWAAFNYVQWASYDKIRMRWWNSLGVKWHLVPIELDERWVYLYKSINNQPRQLMTYRVFPYQCTERVNLPFDNVINCYTHPLGEVLQLQAERMTNEIQYPLAWVPTITYNWVSYISNNEDWRHWPRLFAGVWSTVVQTVRAKFQGGYLRTIEQFAPDMPPMKVKNCRKFHEIQPDEFPINKNKFGLISVT